jgi:hypothetical protein
MAGAFRNSNNERILSVIFKEWDLKKYRLPVISNCSFIKSAC